MKGVDHSLRRDAMFESLLARWMHDYKLSSAIMRDLISMWQTLSAHGIVGQRNIICSRTPFVLFIGRNNFSETEYPGCPCTTVR